MMFLLRKDQLYEEYMYQLYVFWQVHQMQEIRGKIDFTQMNLYSDTPDVYTTLCDHIV